MRELTVFDTAYLAGLLLLSLVLPLLVAFGSLKTEVNKKLAMRTVWSGQMILVAAGLVVLLSARIAPYAATASLVGCLFCALVLLRSCPNAQGNDRNRLN